MFHRLNTSTCGIISAEVLLSLQYNIKLFVYKIIVIYVYHKLWLDLKNLASTHRVKLMILPEISCWLNTLSYFTLCLAQKSRIWFLSLTLCKPQVVLWRHWLVMILLEWCLEGWVSHDRLTNVFYLQFGMLWAQGKSNKAPNGTFAFNCLCTSFYTPILSQPSTPHLPTLLLPCAILFLSQKTAPNSLNFGCLKEWSAIHIDIDTVN